MATRLTISLAIAASVFVLSGCRTYQGGAVDEYDQGYGTAGGPAESPTFRPGMNPNDIRDPASVTRPRPAPVPIP